MDFVSWRAGAVDWGAFDGVIIRTPWDYHREPSDFLVVLERIEEVTRLANAVDLVRGNLRKTYLRDLEESGIPVPRTVWFDVFAGDSLEAVFERLDAPEVVIKPVVGASGEDTFRLARGDVERRSPEVAATLDGRGVMVQPFLPAVIEEGEWAVVYMAGRRSHSVLKRAAPGEYRVQEEHGGTVELAQPEAALVEVADRAVGWVEPAPLYARVDLLRDDRRGWVVGELELIEPALYLRADPGAPIRFADAIESWLG